MRARLCKFASSWVEVITPGSSGSRIINHVPRRLLEEIVSISDTFVEGAGQQARALYKLAVIHEGRGLQAESMACRTKSLELRVKLKPELKDAPFEEAEFDKLCLWMLW